MDMQIFKALELTVTCSSLSGSAQKLFGLLGNWSHKIQHTLPNRECNPGT